MSALILDGNSLTIATLMQCINNPKTCSVSLADEAVDAINSSRQQIEDWVEAGAVIYGVTTGFGEFANVSIGKDGLAALQENLILSHAVGSGNWLSRDVVRAMLILRVNALAKGFSGIRLSTVQTLLDMVNNDIIPAVPEQGSVGSSGDLIPLSHIALALIGKGRILMPDGSVQPSANVLEEANISPVVLGAKEGLALINGTQMMTALGAIATYKAENLVQTADISGALSLEALRGTDNAFDERLHKARGQVGQLQSAEQLRKLIRGSAIRESHRTGDGKVQDPYSLRCMPQVHGASRDAIDYVKGIVEIEMNSANDNPLVFAEDGEYVEGGNFHGQPMALALDFLCIAVSELANIAERRTERLVNGSLSGLPRFLTKHGGLHSGLMIAQYNSAALVSENKVLSHPAAVDSIPTSANQEDHNSMGSISARKALKIAQNVETVLAIELLTAAQGIDFLRPLTSSNALEAVHSAIREVVPFMDEDREIYPDVETLVQLVQAGTLVEVVESSFEH